MFDILYSAKGIQYKDLFKIVSAIKYIIYWYKEHKRTCNKNI
jgi:hypothetical protein